MKKGMVYLVGAGSGDPALLTQKGQQCLQLADLVVYDALASVSILNHVRPDCELYFVGKRAGNHSLPQVEINQLLVDAAKQGKQVVRLKGGDPFVFGRGGEEAQALSAANVPFVIVHPMVFLLMLEFRLRIGIMPLRFMLSQDIHKQTRNKSQIMQNWQS